MLLMGSISLGNFSCSSDGDDNSLEMEKTVSPIIKTEPEIDLSQVFEKRIEGKNEEAIVLLRSLNEKHPASIEVMIQLARTLLDAQQFPLAAFRFEQALSLKSDHSLPKRQLKPIISPGILTLLSNDTANTFQPIQMIQQVN